MKIRDLFNYVHKIKENPFEDSELLVWLNEVEGLVHTKVFLLAPSEYKEITADDIDSDTFKLLIVGPHQKIYPAYLVAMIDFANGEYNRYANTLEMFNAHFTELQMWQRQYAGPADGECVFRGYYLSAYGIAKNRGVFNGSEEEWLASLKGEKGDSAYDIAVKLGYKGSEQEWIDYLAKAQSDAIDAARKSALEDIESNYNTADSLINSARETALQRIAEANEELSSNLGEYHSGFDDHYSHIAAELGSLRGDSIDEIAGAKTAAIDEIESTGSIFANALRGTASGEAIAITDASPIEHEMGVRVSGVSDISTVKVKRHGKNLFKATTEQKVLKGITAEKQADGTYHVYGTSDGTGDFWMDMQVVLPKGIYTGSGSPAGASSTTHFIEYHNRTTGKGKVDYGTGATFETAETNTIVIHMAVKSGQTVDLIFKPMIEAGTGDKVYEPYIEPIEYPVSADGTVEGVTPIYPTTTLMTDTAGAVIDCTYNRDINKAFEALYNAIISMGGNV